MPRRDIGIIIIKKVCRRPLLLSVFALVVAAGLLASHTTVDAQTRATGIAAVVNNDVVTHLDLESRIRMVIVSAELPKTRETARRLRAQVLRNLIDEKLKIQEAKRLQIDVSDQEINAAIRDIERRNNMQPGDIGKMLASNNIDRGSLESQIRSEISWARIVAAQLGRVNVADDQIQERIGLIEAGKGKPEYLVSEIFVPFDVRGSREEAQRQVQDLVQQISSGANFASLARTFSQSASAAQGGSLGWVRGEQLDPLVGATLAQLSPGQVGKPIAGPDGYYILLVRNRRISRGLGGGDPTLNLQQVFFPVSAGATEQSLRQVLNEAEAFGASVSSCQEMETKGKEVGSRQSGRLSDVKLSSLSGPLRRAIEDLPIGKASQPVRSGSGIVVLMVCERRGELTEDEIRTRIATALRRERGELISRRLLRNLRRQAFVQVR